MAEAAAELLCGSGWLPVPLRTPGHSVVVEIGATDATEHATADAHLIAAE